MLILNKGTKFICSVEKANFYPSKNAPECNKKAPGEKYKANAIIFITPFTYEFDDSEVQTSSVPYGSGIRNHEHGVLYIFQASKSLIYNIMAHIK